MIKNGNNDERNNKNNKARIGVIIENYSCCN